MMKTDRKQWWGLVAIGVSLAMAFLDCSKSKAEDWPQWFGPRRDGSIQEPGLIERIPEGGLKRLWSQPVGLGYAGPAVAGGRVFVSDYLKESGEITNNPSLRDQLRGQERLQCLDAESGEVLWDHRYPRNYSISYPAGPRATPAVEGDRVVHLGAEGDLICFSVEDGKVAWQKKLPEVYGSETPIWGHAASPLIVDGQGIVLAGGEGAYVVSIDLQSGKEQWRALTAKELGYCPAVVVTFGGVRQLMVWDPEVLHSLDPATGKELWSVPIAPSYGMSIAPPVVSGDRMYVSGIGEASVMLKLKADPAGAEVLWRGKSKMALYSGNAAPIFHSGFVYGADCGAGNLICFDAADGTRRWETYQPTAGGTRRVSHGTAFIHSLGNDRYLVLTETGDLVIAKLTPQEYQEQSRFHVIDPTNECFGRPVVWSYPAIANGKLYVRNDREIACYNLSADGATGSR
jgi:outer membrane protein assembly factor BamB